MLARIAHELFWLGRSVARADHAARILDGPRNTPLMGGTSEYQRPCPILT